MTETRDTPADTDRTGGAHSAVVIGLGNAWRGDDAAGIEVAHRVSAAVPGRVRVIERASGDLTGLIYDWRGSDVAVIVDAACTGAAAGTVHHYNAASAPVPPRVLAAPSHALGVAQAIERARALGRLPPVLSVYGIEGASFQTGASLSPAVEEAVQRVVGEIAREVAPAEPARGHRRSGREP